MPLKNLPNLLIIAGTGRNSGKTTLACSIIQKHSGQFSVAGIKISPHFHREDNLKPFCSGEGFHIYRETDNKRSKDSSRMLAAGADRVFYIETDDISLDHAFETLLKSIPPFMAMVCESPALRNHVIPGLFIIADHPLTLNRKENVLLMKESADLFIDTSDPVQKAQLMNIRYGEEGWQIHGSP